MCRPNQQGFESGSRFGANSVRSEADADLDVEAGSALPAGLQHDREMQHQVRWLPADCLVWNVGQRLVEGIQSKTTIHIPLATVSQGNVLLWGNALLWKCPDGPTMRPEVVFSPILHDWLRVSRIANFHVL